jgi:uncharacterized coiled-coil DUF342 family protein
MDANEIRNNAFVTEIARQRNEAQERCAQLVAQATVLSTELLAAKQKIAALTEERDALKEKVDAMEQEGPGAEPPKPKKKTWSAPTA